MIKSLLYWSHPFCRSFIMARVTVEDCIEKVKNRFELVLMSARRAKDIDLGAQPSVPKNNDKPTIIALREIAEETISLEGLREIAKRGVVDGNESMSTIINPNPEEEEEDLSALMSEEDEEEYEEDAEVILDDDDLRALQAIDNALNEDTASDIVSEEEEV